MVAKPSGTPSSITTQEQLLIWAIMAGTESFSQTAFAERPGLTSWACEWQVVKSPGDSQLFVGRVVIPMLPTSEVAANSKPWLGASTVPQAAVISSYYSSN